MFFTFYEAYPSKKSPRICTPRAVFYLAHLLLDVCGSMVSSL